MPRESVYDKAWLGSVNPGDRLVIDEALWRQFPKEYAVLAYLQEKIGGRVKRDMPAGLKGEALQELNGRGEAWLAGTLDKPWTRKQAPGSTMAGCRARLRQPRSGPGPAEVVPRAEMGDASGLPCPLSLAHPRVPQPAPGPPGLLHGLGTQLNCPCAASPADATSPRSA